MVKFITGLVVDFLQVTVVVCIAWLIGSAFGMPQPLLHVMATTLISAFVAVKIWLPAPEVRIGIREKESSDSPSKSLQEAVLKAKEGQGIPPEKSLQEMVDSGEISKEEGAKKLREGATSMLKDLGMGDVFDEMSDEEMDIICKSIVSGESQDVCMTRLKNNKKDSTDGE